MNSTVRMAAEDRRALEKVFAERGEGAAARALGVHPYTLLRAMAGAGIQRTTAAALRAKLLELPRPTP